MPNTVRHVLKADEVVVEGVCRLDIDPVAPAGAGRTPAHGASAARIVQRHPDHAVIEVTCACGKTIQVLCEYGADDAPAARGPAVS